MVEPGATFRVSTGIIVLERQADILFNDALPS